MTCMSFQQSRVWVSLFWAMGPSHLQHFLQDGRVSVAIFWYPESRGKCKPKVLELTKAETEWNICQMPYILILSDSQILKLTLLICALTLRWILVLHDGSNGCIIKSGPVCDSCGAAAPFESKDGRGCPVDCQRLVWSYTHTKCTQFENPDFCILLMDLAILFFEVLLDQICRFTEAFLTASLVGTNGSRLEVMRLKMMPCCKQLYNFQCWSNDVPSQLGPLNCSKECIYKFWIWSWLCMSGVDRSLLIGIVFDWMNLSESINWKFLLLFLAEPEKSTKLENVTGCERPFRSLTGNVCAARLCLGCLVLTRAKNRRSPNGWMLSSMEAVFLEDSPTNPVAMCWPTF